jgi:methylmalonyl-CoA mutase N-terminal domain/subunit
MGGAVAAIEKEFQQKKIAQSAFQYQQNLDNDKRIIVGVNKYTSDKQTETRLQNIDQNSIIKQINRIKVYKKNRDEQKVLSSLKKLSNNADTKGNLMPTIINALKSRCTLGEISDTLRKQFGEHS